MGKRNLSGWIVAFTFFVLLCYPSSALADKKEDTAHLSLKKTAISKEKLDTYIVEKGDWIFNIIRKKFGASEKEIMKIMEEVRRLNPKIKDFHKISPGQKLVLPPKDTPSEIGKASIGSAETRDTAVKGEQVKRDESKAPTKKYTVKEGETLSDIIHEELNVTEEDIYRILRTVRRLNPNVKNINAIYPGQKLLLPFITKKKAPPVIKEAPPETIVEKKKIVKHEEKKVVQKEQIVSPEKTIAVIRYVLSRINGTTVSKGKYFIPFFPSGQVTIDCAAVPIVEFDNGMTVLLDFAEHIPTELKQVIESTWKNYAVLSVRDDQDLPVILNEIITASGDHTFKKVGKFIEIGTHPIVKIYADWMVSKKAPAGGSSYSFGIKRVENRASLLPANVREYIDGNGFEIIELLQGPEVAGITEAYRDLDVFILKTDTNMALVESLLTSLGFSPSAQSTVQIYNIEDNGFELSIKMDLSLNVDGTPINFHSKEIPGHFRDILTRKGIDVLYISDEEKKKEIVKKVLTQLGVPFHADTFRFSFSTWEGKNGGEILISAIRVKDKNSFIYFIDQDIDKTIYGLLHRKWGVNLIRY